MGVFQKLSGQFKKEMNSLKNLPKSMREDEKARILKKKKTEYIIGTYKATLADLPQESPKAKMVATVDGVELYFSIKKTPVATFTWDEIEGFDYGMEETSKVVREKDVTFRNILYLKDNKAVEFAIPKSDNFRSKHFRRYVRLFVNYYGDEN